jgi:hypothetical protein
MLVVVDGVSSCCQASTGASVRSRLHVADPTCPRVTLGQGQCGAGPCLCVSLGQMEVECWSDTWQMEVRDHKTAN